MKPHTAILLFSVALSTLPIANAWSRSEHDHGATATGAPRASRAQAYGRPGDARKATRTVNVDTFDTMRFDPADITVRQGETVRFIVANKGVLPHELVFGTKETLAAHAEEMRKHPHGAHDDPGAVRVEPGQKKEIVWEFTNAGNVDFGCLLPGHFEAGMAGKVKVTKAEP